MKNRFYTVVKFFLSPILKLVYWIKIEGKENEPDKPYLLIANHSAYIDPVLLALAMKQHQHFVARSSLTRFAFYRWFFKKARVIAISQGESDVTAVRTAIKTLQSGECVGIFPQGTRMKGVLPQSSQAQAGAALIALQAKVSVVPVSIITKALTPKAFHRTKIVIGKPIPYEEYIEKADGKREVMTYCFGKVCDKFEDWSQDA